MRTDSRTWLIIVLWAVLLTTGCQNQNRQRQSTSNTPATTTANPITPANTDLYVQGERFQRVNALIGQWDLAKSEGRTEHAARIAAQIRQEVDADYAAFETASRGQSGASTQYLATSALGFASSPNATRALAERLGDRDEHLVSNAMVALNERADPDTPLGPVVQYIDPRAPLLPKRYSPLLFATILDARRRAGQRVADEGTQTALTRLGTIANDADGFTRLHVTKALGVIGTPGAVEMLLVRLGDEQMRVRWAAAAALERIGDPRGFMEVVRLLNDVAPSSRHIIRDVLASYAERLQGGPLSDREILELGVSPAQWSRWFSRFENARGLGTPTPPR